MVERLVFAPIHSWSDPSGVRAQRGGIRAVRRPGQLVDICIKSRHPIITINIERHLWMGRVGNWRGQLWVRESNQWVSGSWTRIFPNLCTSLLNVLSHERCAWLGGSIRSFTTLTYKDPESIAGALAADRLVWMSHWCGRLTVQKSIAHHRAQNSLEKHEHLTKRRVDW